VSTRVRFTVDDLRAAIDALEVIDGIKAEAQAFADRMAEQTGVADFLDIPTGDAFDVSPEAAISFFRAKGLRTSFSYADMVGEAHDHAFTVAKMMDVDMLAQVRASLDSALANGTSFKVWTKELEPILKSGGWWGKADMIDPATGQTVSAQLGSPWRLETIFRTNMQTAYAVQAWNEIEAQADLAPWLMYDAVDDHRTREQHRRWDRTVLPWDHPWFKAHMPPLGYNCRCGVIQLSQDDLHGMGISPTPAPEDGTYKWSNPRTGIVHRVPDGVDPGFDRNPGETYLADLMRLVNEKISVLPDSMRAPAAAGLALEPMQSAAGKASTIVVDMAGDVQTAAQLNALINGPIVGYIEARIIGAAPTAEQIASYNRLPSRDRREIDRRIALGA
jgi:SPP1 gp7 family putative phage head morphogenesis protein